MQFGYLYAVTWIEHFERIFHDRKYISLLQDEKMNVVSCQVYIVNIFRRIDMVYSFPHNQSVSRVHLVYWGSLYLLICFVVLTGYFAIVPSFMWLSIARVRFVFARMNALIGILSSENRDEKAKRKRGNFFSIVPIKLHNI